MVKMSAATDKGKSNGRDEQPLDASSMKPAGCGRQRLVNRDCGRFQRGKLDIPDKRNFLALRLAARRLFLIQLQSPNAAAQGS